MRTDRKVVVAGKAIAVALALGTVACSASIRPYSGGQPVDTTLPGAPGPVATPRTGPMLGGVQSEWMSLNLLDEGIDAVIAVPEGAVVQDAVDGVRIARGTDFAIEILLGPTDIAIQRTQIETDAERKLVRFHTDTDDTLVYETAVPGRPSESEFHFVTSIETGDRDSGGRSYTCKDARTHRYSLAAVVDMVRSCWSLTQRGTGLED